MYENYSAANLRLTDEQKAKVEAKLPEAAQIVRKHFRRIERIRLNEEDVIQDVALQVLMRIVRYDSVRWDAPEFMGLLVKAIKSRIQELGFEYRFPIPVGKHWASRNHNPHLRHLIDEQIQNGPISIQDGPNGGEIEDHRTAENEKFEDWEYSDYLLRLLGGDQRRAVELRMAGDLTDGEIAFKLGKTAEEFAQLIAEAQKTIASALHDDDQAVPQAVPVSADILVEQPKVPGTRALDIEGQRFGLLTAVRYVSRSVWLWACDCGGTIELNTQAVRTRKIPNCGCLGPTRRGRASACNDKFPANH